MTATLDINGRTVTVKADPETPLLWVLRDELGLTGTKFGCGMAQCGACTVHVNGDPVRSCVTPIATLNGAKIATIESLGGTHPLQKAWVAHDVPQCGYCQSGQIMSAAALLAQTKSPSDEDIDNAMSGNICRCGTYQRIRAAIKDAAGLASASLVNAPAATTAANEIDAEIAAASGSTGRGANP
ncbi:(2Fe-2S)-binding protein [Caulobacter sp. DWP3-1-3b2]|uniref:(2Fe-2S)-binding protein n=1 Tax=Caulobacter sp. DWP3-1-3b2 TaxID=2804643 RepID=UPI003CFB1A9A